MGQPQIHPTAVVDSSAQFGEDVVVGPHAVIGADVTLGARCVVRPHALLEGPLVAGEECRFGFSTAIGLDPQIKGGTGPWGGVRLGNRVVCREFVQIHGSGDPSRETFIGDDVYLMVSAHVAHDCVVKDHVIMANHVALGGHVVVEERAFLAGLAMVQQYSRIGTLAMVGGGAGIQRDMPPYCTTSGRRPRKLEGLNVVGLRRAGIPSEARTELNRAYRQLFRSDLPIPERLDTVELTCPEVARLVQFCRDSERGVIGLNPSRE